MALTAGAALVAAESILALTPVAIKKSPLDAVSAIWSRILTSGALGYAISSHHTLEQGEVARSAALGYTNLLHIASSYESFRNLPAGQAMSILYTYPLWNLILNHLFLGTAVSTREYGLMTMAAIGSVILNLSPGEAAETPLVRNPSQPWGILMALIMALTESGMNVLLRSLDWKDAAKSVWVVNGGASIWLLGARLLQGLFDGKTQQWGLESGTWWDAIMLTAFHGISMFSGYWLRFFAIPRLSVVTYAMLSYAGLLASYLFGMLFVGERPGWISIVGAAIIVISGLLLQTSAGSAA